MCFHAVDGIRLGCCGGAECLEEEEEREASVSTREVVLTCMASTEATLSSLSLQHESSSSLMLTMDWNECSWMDLMTIESWRGGWKYSTCSRSQVFLGMRGVFRVSEVPFSGSQRPIHGLAESSKHPLSIEDTEENKADDWMVEAPVSENPDRKEECSIVEDPVPPRRLGQGVTLISCSSSSHSSSPKTLWNTSSRSKDPDCNPRGDPNNSISALESCRRGMTGVSCSDLAIKSGTRTSQESKECARNRSSEDRETTASVSAKVLEGFRIGMESIVAALSCLRSKGHAFESFMVDIDLSAFLAMQRPRITTCFLLTNSRSADSWQMEPRGETVVLHEPTRKGS